MTRLILGSLYRNEPIRETATLLSTAEIYDHSRITCWRSVFDRRTAMVGLSDDPINGFGVARLFADRVHRFG
jgi:hypothetical protein